MAVLWPPSDYIQYVYRLNFTFTTVLLSIVVCVCVCTCVSSAAQQNPKQVFSMGKLLIFC